MNTEMKKKGRKLFAIVLQIQPLQSKRSNNLKEKRLPITGKRFYLRKNKAIALLSLGCISHR